MLLQDEVVIIRIGMGNHQSRKSPAIPLAGIIGIVVVSIAVVVIAIIILYLICFRRPKEKEHVDSPGKEAIYVEINTDCSSTSDPNSNYARVEFRGKSDKFQRPGPASTVRQQGAIYAEIQNTGDTQVPALPERRAPEPTYANINIQSSV